ncbi:ATP-binding cassette domain-containing protein [Streptomyces canus]|uniref:ATP-binding cassette domain-containing protein n=1 Tax=Streptomyces canus TaxID=58343 RepID=UPI0032476E1D
MSGPLLELDGIRAAHGGITVRHGVDLAVEEGRVVALLGPNGAGKTTLLSVAAGVHPPSAGRLLLGGRDTTGVHPRIGNAALNAVAGRPKEEYGMEPQGLDEIRPGCYDVDERVADMNAGGVLAQLNFPSFPGFSARLFAT